MRRRIFKEKLHITESETLNTSTIMSTSVEMKQGTQLDWNEIKNRWGSVLPENELKILEILVTQGSMNQKRLAKHLGVSKVTMSRLISRLELKRLIYRERLGMSKIISLNEDVL